MCFLVAQKMLCILRCLGPSSFLAPVPALLLPAFGLALYISFASLSWSLTRSCSSRMTCSFACFALFATCPVGCNFSLLANYLGMFASTIAFYGGRVQPSTLSWILSPPCCSMACYARLRINAKRVDLCYPHGELPQCWQLWLHGLASPSNVARPACRFPCARG